MNVALLELAPGAAVYTIDVHARSDDSVGLDIDAIIAWQHRAHGAVVESFDLTNTAEARRLFKENPCPP